MIEGFDQSPSHDVHSSITLAISVFQKVPVSGKVSVLLGYMLLLIVHPCKKYWQGSALCNRTPRIGHGGQISIIKGLLELEFDVGGQNHHQKHHKQNHEKQNARLNFGQG